MRAHHTLTPKFTFDLCSSCSLRLPRLTPFVFDVLRSKGGSIIKFFYRDSAINCDYPDATATWHAFHSRSKRARRVLDSLPSRVYDDSERESKGNCCASPEDDQMVTNFKIFESELRTEGFFDPSIFHVFLRILEVFFLFFAGYHLYLREWWIFGSVFFGLAQGKCGWLEHEGMS